MTDKRKILFTGIISVVLAGFLASCALFYPAGLYRDVTALTSTLGTPVIMPVPIGSDYSHGFGYPTVYKGEIYFAGTNTSSEPKIYKISKTDGTIYEVVSSYNSNYNYPIIYNDILYFEATDSNYTLLMLRYDGNTVARVPATTTCDHGFSNPIIFNNLLFFQGYDASNAMGYLAFFYDGTAIKRVNQWYNYTNYFSYPAIHPSLNRIYFNGYNTSLIAAMFYVGEDTIGTDDYAIYGTGSIVEYYYTPVSYNNTLYFYDSTSSQMAFVNNDTVSYISSVSGFQSAYFYYGTVVYKNKLYFAGSDNSGNFYHLFRVNVDTMEEPPLVPNSLDYFNKPMVFQDKFFYQCTVTNLTSTNKRIAVYEDIADSMSVLPLQNGIQPYEPVFVYSNQFLFFQGYSNGVTNFYYLNSSNYTLVENRSAQQLYNPGKYILLSNELYFPATISSGSAAPRIFKIIFEK